MSIFLSRVVWLIARHLILFVSSHSTTVIPYLGPLTCRFVYLLFDSKPILPLWISHATILLVQVILSITSIIPFHWFVICTNLWDLCISLKIPETTLLTFGILILLWLRGSNLPYNWKNDRIWYMHIK